MFRVRPGDGFDENARSERARAVPNRRACKARVRAPPPETATAVFPRFITALLNCFATLFIRLPCNLCHAKNRPRTKVPLIPAPLVRRSAANAGTLVPIRFFDACQRQGRPSVMGSMRGEMGKRGPGNPREWVGNGSHSPPTRIRRAPRAHTRQEERGGREIRGDSRGARHELEARRVIRLVRYAGRRPERLAHGSGQRAPSQPHRQECPIGGLRLLIPQQHTTGAP